MYRAPRIGSTMTPKKRKAETKTRVPGRKRETGAVDDQDEGVTSGTIGCHVVREVNGNFVDESHDILCSNTHVMSPSCACLRKLAFILIDGLTVSGVFWCVGLVGDALVDKIVGMHESCAEGSREEADAPTGARRDTDRGSSATPKEYVSFLRGWFAMHEAKKVMRL